MKIKKAELITIPVIVATLQYALPDNAIIRTDSTQMVLTQGIEFFPAEVVAKAPDGTANITSIDLCTGYLYLYIKNGEFFKVPISRLISMHRNTVTAAAAENFPYNEDLPELDNLDINFSKSYVRFPSAISAPGTLVFNVYYDFFTRPNTY